MNTKKKTTGIVLTAYSKLFTMSKEAVNEALAPIRARSQKKRAELEVLKLEEEISKNEQELTELCSKQELNYGAILDKIDTIELAQRRQAKFNDVINQLFPD